MHKTIGLLGVLLTAQLVLAVGMSFTGPNLTGQRPDTPLIDLGDQTVDRLSIAGPDNQQILLVRQSDGWVLPGTGEFPADKAKVESLLEKLKGLKRGLAVGTTASAQKRFKVTDDAFERRIELAGNNETLATLYLGTSPAMRQVHARSDKDKAVYAAMFSVYDAPVKPEEWEDKGVLKVPQGEIATIALGELTLTRAPAASSSEASGNSDKQTAERTSWTSKELVKGETVNQANANTLARDLAGLTFGSVLGLEAKPEYGMEAPVLVFTVQRDGGEMTEYRIGKRDPEKDYVLKVSSRPEYFRLPAYTADALIKAAGRDQLVMAAAEPADEGESEQSTVESTPKDQAGASNATRAQAGTS